MAEIYKTSKEFAAALTKRNHAGQQQPYVPAGNGDESGEYRDNAYGGGDDEGEIINESGETVISNDNKVIEDTNKEPEQKENQDNISLEEDEKAKGSSFLDYVNSAYSKDGKPTEWGDSLIKNYNYGNDDAKSLVDFVSQKYGIRVEKTNGIAYWGGSVVLSQSDLNEQGGFSSYADGEVFYHEFHHCFDEKLSYLLTEEDTKHILANEKSKTKVGGFSFSNAYLLNRNLSTGKVLSNGKTLYETIQEECKVMKKQGVWSQLINDYKEETEGQVLAKYPDWKERQTQFNEVESKIREEARKKFPITWQDLEMDNVMRTKRKEYIKEELEKNAPGFNDYIREVRNYRNQLERDAKKSWMSISDMYGIYYKTPYGFCGGHTGNYSKKIPGAIALEFLAEYGSARSRGDKFAEKEIAIMQKYMPESSKMCDELRNLMIKTVKGE